MGPKRGAGIISPRCCQSSGFGARGQEKIGNRLEFLLATRTGLRGVLKNSGVCAAGLFVRSGKIGGAEVASIMAELQTPKEKKGDRPRFSEKKGDRPRFSPFNAKLTQ